MIQSRSPLRETIVGVLLAGGRSLRMGGGDKCLQMLAGRPLLAHAIERLRPQVETLVINANGDPARFERFGLPVTRDLTPEYRGPLAGILSGMRWAERNTLTARWLAVVPTDTPFFPTDMMLRLHEAEGTSQTIRLAVSAGAPQPVCGLWPLALADKLSIWLARGGSASVLSFVTSHCWVGVPRLDPDPIDPFFNVNTPADLQIANDWVADIGRPASLRVMAATAAASA